MSDTDEATLYPGHWAQTKPDHPAMVMSGSGEVVTFAELDAAANRLARLFRSLGLEPGDYILDVNGYPVGTYNGTYYDLADQLNLYADGSGWVNINIWNFRTQRDKPYWVQMQRR